MRLAWRFCLSYGVGLLTKGGNKSAQLLDIDSSPDAVEEAVKYIIFLVDADRLFDTALGMYDFSLVIMIAQHALKVLSFMTCGCLNKLLFCIQDPREYLPFLRELRALDKYYQRFRVDDHLKRYESALRHLHLAGKWPLVVR